MLRRSTSTAFMILLLWCNSTQSYGQDQPQPLHAPLWSKHGLFTPIKSGMMAEDASWLHVQFIASYSSDDWVNAVFSREKQQVVMTWGRETVLGRLDRKRLSFIRQTSLLTYQASTGQLLDSVDLGITELRFFTESRDGSLLVLRKWLPTSSRHNEHDSLYILDTRTNTIISRIRVVNPRSAYFDERDMALIIGCGVRKNEENAPEVRFGYVDRIEPPQYDSSTRLLDGREYDVQACIPGYMFTAEGIYSTTTPVKYIGHGVGGLLLRSGRYVTVSNKYDLFDSTFTRILSLDKAANLEEFVAEDLDGNLLVCRNGYTIRGNPRTRTIDTIQTEKYALEKREHTRGWRVSQRYLAVVNQHFGTRHYDLYQGRFVDVLSFPAAAVYAISSTEHPYNFRIGRNYYNIDPIFGTIIDQTHYDPPKQVSIYARAGDRWYWTEPQTGQTSMTHYSIKSSRSFDTTVNEYIEPFWHVSDVCLSHAGDTAWVASMNGDVFEYDMKTTLPTRKFMAAPTQENQRLYRIATRQHDSTLVCVWGYNDKAHIVHVSLRDTSKKVVRELGLSGVRQTDVANVRFCAMVNSERLGYIAANVYPGAELAIAYDDGRTLTIKTKYAVTAITAMKHDSVLLVLDLAGNVYWVDALTGEVGAQYNTWKFQNSAAIGVDYDEQREVLYVLYDLPKDGFRVVYYLHIPSLTTWTWSKLSRGVCFVNDGKHLADFLATGSASSATYYSILEMKPSKEQPLLNAFPGNEFRHDGSRIAQIIRSADQSAIAYYAPGQYSMIAWVKSPARQIISPMVLNDESMQRLAHSYRGEWVIYDGGYNTHVYAPDLSRKYATISMPGYNWKNSNLTMNPDGTYLIMRPNDHTLLQVSAFKRPLGQPSPEGVVLQFNELTTMQIPNKGTFALNHPSYLAYLSPTYELMIRGLLKNDQPIATGVTLRRSDINLAFSPNYATLAVTDSNKLFLLDGRNFKLIREYDAGGFIHSFDWYSNSTSAYISHSYDTFGRYSFAGVVSVGDTVQPPSDDCYQDITVRAADNHIQIGRTMRDEALLISIFSVDGRLIRSADVGSNVTDVTIDVDRSASQRVIILISGSNCQAIRSVMLK